MAINNPNSTPAENVAPASRVNEKVQGGGGLLNVILAIVLVGLVVLGAFLFFDKGNVLNKTNQLDKDIVDLNAQIATYKDQKVEVSRNAQETLDKIKENEIRWSEVIADVNTLMPADASGQRKVQVISYSGSEQGRIALNMVTEPAGVPPFDSVSALLSTFNNSVFFKNAYVPSISKGQTETGESTLSFVLNLSYQKPETGTADVNFALTPTVTENTVKVPVPTSSESRTTETASDSTPKVPTN